MPRTKQTIPEGFAPMGTPLAPEPTDLEAMMSVEQPLEDLKPLSNLSEGFEAGSGRLIAELTSTGGIQPRHPQGVSHVGPPSRTLYAINGESRSVYHSDVPSLVDTSIPAAVRLYIRCPLCYNLPNRGLHRFAGINQCPAKPKRLWSACPICRSRGTEHRVFEDEAFEQSAVELEKDENYVEPRLPNQIERQERLRRKLDLHMTSFHAGEADQLFGLRRQTINNGRAFIVVENKAGDNAE